MPTASAGVVVDAPRQAVFAYVNEWSHATEYTHDLVKWLPLTEQKAGLGARFDAAMKMGPTTQQSTLEITRWEQDAAIGWEPRDGFSQRGLYEFADGAGGTAVTLTIEFDLPGGLAGRLLGKTIEPVARQNVAKTVEKLKRAVEEQVGRR
ncbi:MAG: SRPBCC family protein [Actinomycetota bacterium]|nr:SRPBCC family protein [Actinomycetota bacterium]